MRPKRPFGFFRCFPVSLGKSSVFASWQSGLLFKLIKFAKWLAIQAHQVCKVACYSSSSFCLLLKLFSDFLSMGAAQFSQVLNSNLISE